MIEIVPAIIAKNFDELHEKIKKVEDFVDWAQLDIMDGKFVPNTTWNNPYELQVISSNLQVKLEAHLMIERPWEFIDKWIKSGVKRIILHFESFGDDFEKLDETIRKIKDSNIQAAIAVNPSTPWESLRHFVDKIDVMFMMTVEPGFGGQEFIEDVLYKITDFKKHFPNTPVEVDGGIKVGTAKKVARAGADILGAGSFIYNHPEGIEGAIQNLKEDAEII